LITGRPSLVLRLFGAQSIEPDFVERPQLVQELDLGADEILKTLLAYSGQLRSHLL
jgi:hypothetical protein